MPAEVSRTALRAREQFFQCWDKQVGKHGASLRQMAQATGISYHRLSQWGSSKYNMKLKPTEEEANQLANFFKFNQVERDFFALLARGCDLEHAQETLGEDIPADFIFINP